MEIKLEVPESIDELGCKYCRRKHKKMSSPATGLKIEK